MAKHRVSAKSLANLKNFPPGVSGNPGGHPKGEINLSAIAKRELAGHPEQALAIVQQWLAGALEQNPALLRELLDRTEGKVPLPIAGAGGGPIEIIIKWVKWDENRRSTG